VNPLRVASTCPRRSGFAGSVDAVLYASADAWYAARIVAFNSASGETVVEVVAGALVVEVVVGANVEVVVAEVDADVELDVVLGAAFVLSHAVSAKATRPTPSRRRESHHLSRHHCECTSAHLQRSTR
jgi:hypothetical protein